MANSRLLAAGLSLLVLLLIASCGVERRVIILNGCDDDEVLFDLYAHTEKVAPFLIKNAIDTVYSDSLAECGFILQMGPREKHINGVVTDVDLVDECKSFFGLK
ncbi:MAG: hypothetical protein PHR28_01295 [candidate division Zixibacteria bacterium]|nr:hypothetical protein [candidate division Zixibacteria bacterium]